MKTAEKVFWCSDTFYDKIKAAFDRYMEGCEVVAYHEDAEKAGVDYFVFQEKIVARIPLDGPSFSEEEKEEMERVLVVKI